ncbi:MAG: M23 family metallopeptidase [Alphaproteobacteria bacterium]|nr:M23 family metallopeptidase [Alphaproteobacteria bacterium]
MLWRSILACLLSFILSSCSSDTKLFGYTLWGRPYYGNSSSSVRVQKGDTLYSIARANDVPIREIIEINNFRPPYTLRIGQIVALPKAKYHIVEKGDTLYNISKRYNVDMPTLSRTNNLVAPFTLKLGQRLLLPGSIVTRQKNYIKTSQKTKTTTQKSSYSKYTYKQPSTKRKQKFVWPVNGKVISNYGPIAKGRNNDGINIKAPKGTPIKAADNGTVAYAGNELKGFGNLILIKHNDGWVTAYAHADRINVSKGQKVTKGATIGTVGTSGGVSTPQLHFETRAGKKALNPKAYLQ